MSCDLNDTPIINTTPQTLSRNNGTAQNTSPVIENNKTTPNVESSFRILRRTPQDNANEVDPNTEISVIFSEGLAQLPTSTLRKKDGKWQDTATLEQDGGDIRAFNLEGNTENSVVIWKQRNASLESDLWSKTYAFAKNEWNPSQRLSDPKYGPVGNYKLEKNNADEFVAAWVQRSTEESSVWVAIHENNQWLPPTKIDRYPTTSIISLNLAINDDKKFHVNPNGTGT